MKSKTKIAERRRINQVASEPQFGKNSRRKMKKRRETKKRDMDVGFSWEGG